MAKLQGSRPFLSPIAICLDLPVETARSGEEAEGDNCMQRDWAACPPIPSKKLVISIKERTVSQGQQGDRSHRVLGRMLLPARPPFIVWQRERMKF